METKRVTVSLPVEVVTLLDDISRRLGYSRSSLLSRILIDTTPHLVQVCNSLPDPDDVTPDSVRRFKGKSIDALNDLYQDALEQIDSNPQWGLPIED